MKIIRAALVLALATLALPAFGQTRPADPASSAQSKFLIFDAPAKALLAQMTLDEKLGQMMQPDQGSLKDPADVEKYFLGSLLSGGGSGPKNKANYTLQGWTDMVESYQKHAMSTRLKIPLLYGIDAVHGQNNIPGATLFPHNIALGCTRDPELVEKIERITAEEVRATAINWVFAPCITVPQDIRWGRTYEGFSADPDIVGPLGAAAVRGFQGNLSDPTNVTACAKHFIGDGGTTFGTGQRGRGLDQGDTRVDEETLRKIHLPGYIWAVNAGVATIMPSYSSWNGLKVSANKHLLTDILKTELGFQGFLISDYNAVDQIDRDPKHAVEISVNAGMDMIMLTTKYPDLFRYLHELVDEKKIPMERIDDAVTRILRVKFAAGLMDKNYSPLADRNLQKNFGSPEHRAVARQAVQESLVLLKNENKILPLNKSLRHIVVVGAGAEKPGMQCGGWTIDWQGAADRPVPGATTFLTALKNTVNKETQITYSPDAANLPKDADLAIVILAENPYAESNGDSPSVALTPQELVPLTRVKTNAPNLPIVTILYSGRPILLGNAFDQSNAFVAAWLPGSEAEGITDVLFNSAPFKGKLSFPWPRAINQLPEGHGDNDPLFPIGYGLTYGP